MKRRRRRKQEAAYGETYEDNMRSAPVKVRMKLKVSEDWGGGVAFLWFLPQTVYKRWTWDEISPLKLASLMVARTTVTL